MSGKTLYRSRSQRMLSGVCGGLGEFFNLDPTLVRLGFVFGSLLGFAGAFVLTYIIMVLIVPESPLETGQSSSVAQADVIDVTSTDQA